MALWVSRSTTLSQYLLRREIMKRCIDHSLFHVNSSYKTLASRRSPRGLSASTLSFRRSESARAGEHLAHNIDDDQENQTGENSRMASWVSRSRILSHLLKREIMRFASPTHSLFNGKSSYKTLASGSPRGLRDESAATLSFRRSESARAGEHVAAVACSDTDSDEDEKQGMDFPGGRVTFTPEMKFISESSDRRIPCYRVLDDDGCPIEGSAYKQVDKETAVNMYRSMVTLQIMDTLFYEAQRQGRISFYLTSMGEEAINIATAAALSHHDIVLPQYREPGILLWRGFTPQDYAHQLFGTKEDYGKGRQMPIHYGSKQHNFITVSSPIATQLPQSVGVAYSLKMDNKEACVVAFTRDGGTSEGDFHAAMNFAAVMEAPVMFVCRNNGWAISTPVSQQFRSDGVVVKGQAYGIRSIRVDGNDALAVYSAISSAREMIIPQQKPILIEALTYRVGHHSTSDDSTKYRSLDEIEHWKTGRNPTTRFRKWVERNGWWNEDEETELRRSVRKQVLNAIQIAEKTEKPSLEELFTEVYDHMPLNLQEQQKSLRETIKRHQQDFPADVPLSS